jgi:hypothetical protein
MSGYSQFYVGYSKETTAAVLNNLNISYETQQLSDTTSRISYFYKDEYQMIILLDNEGIVRRQTLIPLDPYDINPLIKWLNKDLVAISATEWRSYEIGKIFRIELQYLLDNPIFSITQIQNR